MKLKTHIAITGPYKGKSKFDLFNNLMPGDIIEVSTEIKASARGPSGGLYATGVTLENLRTSDKFSDSMTMVTKYLANMEFDELS